MASFWIYSFPFSFSIVTLQLIIFYKRKWWEETGKKEEEYLLHNIGKSNSPSQDSNPAYPGRMPSLYHLCLHHFLMFIKPKHLFQPCRQEASQRPQVFSGDRPSGHALHPLEAVPPRIRLQLKGLDQGHLPVGGPRHVALAPPELHFKGSVLLKLSSWLLGWRYSDSLITPSSPVRIPLLRGLHFLCII